MRNIRKSNARKSLRSIVVRGLGWVLAAGIPNIGWSQDAPATPPVAVTHGHSYMGETFNEGPRQRAYLMGTTGPVRFPATTQNPEVQAFVNQGVGQLHGFWYLESERSF